MDIREALVEILTDVWYHVNSADQGVQEIMDLLDSDPTVADSRKGQEAEPIYQVWFSKGQWTDVPKSVFDQEPNRDRSRVVYTYPAPAQESKVPAEVTESDAPAYSWEVERRSWVEGWNQCVSAMRSATSTPPEPQWKWWGDEKPSEPGVYLSYWSDGAIESYPFDDDDLDSSAIMVGNIMLVAWIELPQPPRESE